MPALLALGLPAHAQVTPKAAAPEDTTLQEVVVTGSRIARPEFDNLEPTTAIDSKTFDARGYLDVGQALNELPAFGVAPSSAANTQAGFGVAQSFVDLYGLGSQRTLTLVNGRRFVSESSATLNNSNSNTANGGNGTQVDLNVIPTKLIDHVEVISVGGAPIYGADAIAGVVNIILKKDYQGLDVDAQVGASGQGDAWNYRARVLGGQNLFDGRANITAVAEFTKTDGLVGASRPVYASDLGFLAPATPGKFNAVLTPANSVPAVSFGGVPLVDDAFFSPGIFGVPNSTLGVTNGAGQVTQFGPNGQLIPYNVGTPTGNPIFNSGGDGERLSQVSNLLAPTERINLDTLMHFQINDRINAFGEGYFSETHATNLLAQPAYNTGLFGTAGTPNGNFVISINNPYLTPTDRGLIQTALNNYAASFPFGGPLYGGVTAGPGQPVSYPAWNTSQFYISRASVDLQSGRATDTQTVARGVAGLNGDFTFASRNFNWEVSVSYGASDNTQVTPSYVFQNAANALNATTNAAGQIVCAGTPVNAPTTTASSTCAPLNVFGNGSPSVAALQYITHLASVDSFNTQRDTNAFIGGDILKVPAGEWKFSAGFENRRESASFNPDTFYTDNLGQAQVTAVAGSYITNEGYFETLLPIFSPMQDIPGLDRLELEGAVRRVDNSFAGTATTYTYALRWSPIEDVQFRGNKTKSIRAPSITELFLPSASTFSFANDPCDKNFVNQGPVPATRAANCAAAIPGYNPANFTSNVVNATALGSTSGNQNLQSEIAFSKTFGVVLRPRFVPKLNISVDYIDIALKDAIESLTLTDNLDACYDSSNFPSNPSCTAFTRNGAGQITNFHSGYVNAGLLEFTGIQAALDYTFELPWALGSLQASAHYLDTQRLKSQIATAAPLDISGQIGYSKNKGNIDLLYANGGFSWDWQSIFIGPAQFSNQNTPTSLDVLGVGSWWLINSTIAMKFTPALQARMIIDNVFNKQPPFPAIAGTGGNFANATSVYFSGILGRSLQLEVDYKFY
ncbi:MAG: TonB-dependent receptor [Steroidobacteraceae bacterium]